MQERKVESQLIEINTAADKAAWCFEGGVEILRVLVAPLGTDAGGATVKFDSLQGSTRGDGDVGAVVIPASNQQGQIIYDIPTNGQIKLAPGASVIAEVTAEDVTGLPAVVKIVYRELGELPQNTARVVETA